MNILEEKQIMTPMEIHEKIVANNKAIREMFSPNIFTLNNLVSDLLKENAALQAQCPHSFKDGYCEYCFLEDPNHND